MAPDGGLIPSVPFAWSNCTATVEGPDICPETVSVTCSQVNDAGAASSAAFNMFIDAQWQIVENPTHGVGSWAVYENECASPADITLWGATAMPAECAWHLTGTFTTAGQ
jgi:hypothetical protein